MSKVSKSNDGYLPKPGTIYSIPADTHADLDLQDDKEQIFYRRNYSSGYFRFRRRRH